MSEPEIERWLGNGDPDPGCEAGFAIFDEYCDAMLRGDPIEERFAGLLTHLANCTACREDAESLLDILRAGGESPGR